MFNFKSFWWIVAFSLVVYKATANDYQSIEYNLYLNEIDKRHLIVEVVLRGALDNQVKLALPNEWAGITYTDQLSEIQVLSPAASDWHIDDEGNLTITHVGQSSDVIVRYQLSENKRTNNDPAEVIIQPDLVHFPGYGVFAVPLDTNTAESTDVTINWQAVPKQWHTISSHGTQKSIKRLSVFDLQHALYLAGDVRLYQASTDEAQPVYVSLHGKQGLNDKALVTILNQVTTSQRNFFQEKDVPFYLVSILGDNDTGMHIGTALKNCFTTVLPMSMTQLESTVFFAHEHLHYWIGGKLQNDQHEIANYWWSEGFTEYFSRLISYRAGLISESEYIQEINQLLEWYYLSPVLNEPNSRITKDFWDDYAIEKLPYYRGFVLALYLNDLIKKKSIEHSLDEMVLHLLSQSSDEVFSQKWFESNFLEHMGIDIQQVMTDYIVLGKTIPLHKVDLPIINKPLGRFDLGFDEATFIREKRVTGIDKNSNAYLAGLRENQLIKKWSFPKGLDSPSQLVTLETAGGRYQFVPEHQDKLDVFQISNQLTKAEQTQFQEFFGYPHRVN